MSSLPARFPRSSLLNQAASLESRIHQLLDETNEKIQQAEDRGMGTITTKLAQRYNALDDARRAVNEARVALWELP